MSCSQCSGSGRITKRMSVGKVTCWCCHGREYGCPCTAPRSRHNYKSGGTRCMEANCKRLGGKQWSRETTTKTVKCDACNGTGGRKSRTGYNNYNNNDDDYEEQRRRQQREREAELERQREAERRRYEAQIQEQRRLQEVARQQALAAQQKAENERRERERIEQEMKKNQYLNQVETIYSKLNDVCIPQILDLNNKIEEKYNNIYKLNYDELILENERLKDYHLDILNDPNIQQLVLLGKTGDGKSTFGNRLCGDNSQFADEGPFSVDHAASESVTDRIKRKTLYNNKISVMDTPGIFDSMGRDNFHLNKVIEYLIGANGINAFLLVYKAGRLDSKYQEMLQDLQVMLTKRFWKNAIIIITFCEGSIAQNWNEYKLRFLNSLYLKLHLNSNDIGVHQIVGVCNNDRQSYLSAINEVFDIINSRNKFNKKRFICEQLKSPIDNLKEKTLQIQQNIKALMTKRENKKSVMINYKQQLYELINNGNNYNCSIDQKYPHCLAEVEQILNGILLLNNQCIIHDLSDIQTDCHLQQNRENNNNSNIQQEIKEQEMKNEYVFNDLQSQMQNLGINVNNEMNEFKQFLFSYNISNDVYVKLINNGIDSIQLLRQLNDDHLRDMNINIGSRFKIKDAINNHIRLSK